MSKIIKISAIGTGGKAAGVEFIAKPDSKGKFVLNRKKSSSSVSNTNMAINNIYVNTLEEAYIHLETDQYLINMVCPSGKRALRQFSKVKVEYV